MHGSLVHGMVKTWLLHADHPIVTIVVVMIIIVRPSKPAGEIRRPEKTTGMTIETSRLLFHTYLDKVILLPEMV